jgi:hypothetical protein
VVNHRRDEEREVTLCQYGRAPPLCLHVVSPDSSVKSLGANRVELLHGRDGGMGEHECVWLCLESEGVVVNLDGGEGDGVGLSGRDLGGGGLYGVYRLKESLGRHSSCAMGLFVFVCDEKFV